jgi:hypothetical protein
MALRTDDRGTYRIAGLPPGEYIVGASETNTREDARDEYGMMGMFSNSNMSVSFYQNETSLKQATPVKVEAGQEANDINITIIDRASYTISGTVVAKQGRTPVRAQLSLQSKNDTTALSLFDSGPNAATDEQGRWTFTNIPDGTYVIKVEPASDTEDEDVEAMIRGATTTRDASSIAAATTRPPKKPSLVPRQQEVIVSGADLSGIVIEVSEGARLQGTVVVEGSDKEIPQALNVLLFPRDGSAPIERYGFVRPGGTFTVDKVPAGEFYFSLQELGSKFYLKSITAGGLDLTREPFRIGSGASLDNIRITISSDVATLQGRVVSSRDAKPVRGVVVLLVPSDPALWRFTGSFIPAVTESDGTFRITSAPGSYLVILLSEGENLRAINEAFVRAHTANAKTVTLSPNGRETVELVAPSSP